MPQVIVAGDLFADLILSGFDCWPEPGREVYAEHFHREIGGGAAITACGLAKLGTPCGVLGVVGCDTGEWAIDQLNRYGVNTTGIQVHAGEPTGFTVAVTAPGDRALITYPGANRYLPGLLLEAARSKRIANVQHVHLACTPPLDCVKDLIDDIRRSGCTISLDVGWHEDWLADSRALAFLSQVDIFFPNEIEAQRMSGENDPEACLWWFAANGVRRVALKLGACGAALLWDGSIVRAGAHPVTPLDTTGAGDCFDAGFLHAWLRNRSLADCLRTANVCGALSTESFGGIQAFPSAARLERELES